MKAAEMTDFDIVSAMERYGGSFAKAIAAAAHRADEPNFAKLKSAFPELWAEYADMAARTKDNLTDSRRI